MQLHPESEQRICVSRLRSYHAGEIRVLLTNISGTRVGPSCRITHQPSAGADIQLVESIKGINRSHYSNDINYN